MKKGCTWNIDTGNMFGDQWRERWSVETKISYWEAELRQTDSVAAKSELKRSIAAAKKFLLSDQVIESCSLKLVQVAFQGEPHNIQDDPLFDAALKSIFGDNA